MITEELILIVWHRRRWWNFCREKMRKKEYNQFLPSNALRCISNVCEYLVILAQKIMHKDLI